MMTLRRRARTKQLFLVSKLFHGQGKYGDTHYAFGNDKPRSFMTCAMQIVADRETPTRQCTSVAVPARRPFSTVEISLCVYTTCVWTIRTNEVQTSWDLFRQRIHAVILDSIDEHEALLHGLVGHRYALEGLALLRGPVYTLSYAQNLANTEFFQQTGIVGMTEIA